MRWELWVASHSIPPYLTLSQVTAGSNAPLQPKLYLHTNS